MRRLACDGNRSGILDNLLRKNSPSSIISTARSYDCKPTGPKLKYHSSRRSRFGGEGSWDLCYSLRLLRIESIQRICYRLVVQLSSSEWMGWPLSWQSS